MVSRLVAVYRTSVGKKVAMAVTGVLLVGFVVGHMAGNLKAFQGQDKFNAYAEFLREVGSPVFGSSQLLWVARIGLLAAVVLHIHAATQLTLMARAARPVKYRRPVHEEISYASRTMRWGGVLIFLYIVYHILHMTLGVVHGTFTPHDAYANLVTGLRVPVVALVYGVAVVVLGFHLYHGIWSAFQTLGVNQPGFNRWRRVVAGAVSVVVVGGYLAVPLGVLAGVIPMPQ